MAHSPEDQPHQAVLESGLGAVALNYVAGVSSGSLAGLQEVYPKGLLSLVEVTQNCAQHASELTEGV